MTHDLTALLLSHRQARTTIDQLPPELVPSDLASAYAIQDELIATLGPIGAWKVGPVPENGEPACSPLLASVIHPSGASLARNDLKGLGIEVEVAVTLGQDLPGRDAAYTADDLRPAIGSFHLALELLASRYTDRTSVPQLAGFADLQSNGAIIVGASVEFTTPPEFGDQAISLALDGQIEASTQDGPTTENLLSALAWLANHAASRGHHLKAGTLVITGARLGPIAFSGRTASASAPGLGSVAVTFE